MKMCSVCKLEKSIEEYAFRSKAKGVRQALCRSCHSEKMKQHYADNTNTYKDKAKRNSAKYVEINRANLYDYLMVHPCVDCGNQNPVVLEFDHQRDKFKDVSAMMADCCWSRILEEIEKCEVVCSNCHRIRTAHTFGFWKVNHVPVV